jgi:hypothetical protein
MATRRVANYRFTEHFEDYSIYKKALEKSYIK